MAHLLHRSMMMAVPLAAMLCVGGKAAGQAAGAAASSMAMAGHHGQAKKATREAIEALEEQWRTAQLNGDAAAMDALLSDDFVGITATGQVTTKAQQLDRTRNRSVVLTELNLTDVKVKLIHSVVAVVTSLAEIKGTADGAALTGTFRYTRVYQRLPSGVWKITSFEATRVPDGEGRQRSRQPQP